MTKIISLNIRTLYRDTKRQSEHWWVARYRAIHDYIKEQNPDVICLQEVWWPAKYVLKLGKLGYKKTGWGFSHPIYVRKGAKVSKRAVSIFSTMAIVDGVQYFSVHCRWEEELFQKAMWWIWNRREYVEYIRNNPTIAAGDFNTSNYKKVENTIELYDTRASLKLPSVDTFHNYTKPESHGEIDHFFKCGPMRLLSYEVGPSDLSDHRPIVLTFNVE